MDKEQLLKKLTIAKLKKLCKDNKIKKFSTKSKKELIEMLMDREDINLTEEMIKDLTIRNKLSAKVIDNNNKLLDKDTNEEEKVNDKINKINLIKKPETKIQQLEKLNIQLEEKREKIETVIKEVEAEEKIEEIDPELERQMMVHEMLVEQQEELIKEEIEREEEVQEELEELMKAKEEIVEEIVDKKMDDIMDDKQEQEKEFELARQKAIEEQMEKLKNKEPTPEPIKQEPIEPKKSSHEIFMEKYNKLMQEQMEKLQKEKEQIKPKRIITLKENYGLKLNDPFIIEELEDFIDIILERYE